MIAPGSRTPALIAVLLGLGVGVPGCAPRPPAPVETDVSGTTTVHVRYMEPGGEEIEVRGLRFRHVWEPDLPVGATGRPADRLRNETRRTLSEAELARVVEWIDRGEILELTDPAGRRRLPPFDVPAARTLEVAWGERAVVLAWTADATWTDPAMASRVRAAVGDLRRLAADFTRAD